MTGLRGCLTDALLPGLAAAGTRIDPSWLARPPEPLHPEGGDAADAFLQAATELINEQGYHGASVDRISARLNMTKGAFYHHRASKNDLIVACFERSFAVLRAAIATAEAQSSSGLETLVTLAAPLVRRRLRGTRQGRCPSRRR